MPLDVSAPPRVLCEFDAPVPPQGTEWIIDAAGCAPELLSSLPAMIALCDDLIAQARLHVVGQPQWHQFAGHAGITGMYLLSESHLTCHTFPEFGLAAFNLYCCRERESCDWESLLQRRLRASRVLVREVVRGPAGGGTA